MRALAHSMAVKKKPMSSYLPDFTAEDVSDIDFKLLEKLGVKHLLFDLDQTLRTPYSRKLQPMVIQLLTEVQSSKKFKGLHLVSNNQRNLKRFSDPIGAGVFQPYRSGIRLVRKPNPKFFEYVLGELNCKPNQTVMIGDRLHADVLGGNRVGMYTIYMKKRGAIDYWFDWLLLTRLREKRRFRDALMSHKSKKKKS